MRDMDNMYKWRKANLKRLAFDLNKTAEKDVIDHLEKQKNKKEYIVKLIRDDIKK